MNNVVLYNAVIAGVLGGSESRRWLISTVSADYASAAAVAAAVALQVDSLIPAGNPTDAQANVMVQLVQAVFADRTPTSVTPSQYLSIASAIVAAFNQVGTALITGGFEAQGLNAYSGSTVAGDPTLMPTGLAAPNNNFEFTVLDLKNSNSLRVDFSGGIRQNVGNSTGYVQTRVTYEDLLFDPGNEVHLITFAQFLTVNNQQGLFAGCNYISLANTTNVRLRCYWWANGIATLSITSTFTLLATRMTRITKFLEP